MTSLKEIMDELSKTEEEFVISMPGQVGQHEDSLANSTNYHEIINALHADPILVEPCLNWIRGKQSVIAKAKLDALYTPEQLEELRSRNQ